MRELIEEPVTVWSCELNLSVIQKAMQTIKHVLRGFCSSSFLFSFPQTRINWNTEELVFEIFTDTAYQAGEQVFINYGSHDNKKLAVYYGFVCQYNPLNEVKLDWQRTVEVFPRLSPGKKHFLESHKSCKPLVCSLSGFTFSSKLFMWTIFSNDQNYWTHLGKAEEMPSDERVSHAVGLLLRYAIDELETSDFNRLHKVAGYDYTSSGSYHLFLKIYEDKLSILNMNLRNLDNLGGLLDHENKYNVSSVEHFDNEEIEMRQSDYDDDDYEQYHEEDVWSAADFEDIDEYKFGRDWWVSFMNAFRGSELEQNLNSEFNSIVMQRYKC